MEAMKHAQLLIYWSLIYITIMSLGLLLYFLMCYWNCSFVSVFSGPKHNCITSNHDEIYKLLENKLWDDPNMVITQIANVCNLNFKFSLNYKSNCWIFVTDLKPHTVHRLLCISILANILCELWAVVIFWMQR